MKAPPKVDAVQLALVLLALCQLFSMPRNGTAVIRAAL